jgi:hypothetical protein
MMIQLSVNDETGQLVETISASFEPADLILFRSFVDLMSRIAVEAKAPIAHGASQTHMATPDANKNARHTP